MALALPAPAASVDTLATNVGTIDNQVQQQDNTALLITFVPNTGDKTLTLQWKTNGGTVNYGAPFTVTFENGVTVS